MLAALSAFVVAVVAQASLLAALASLATAAAFVTAFAAFDSILDYMLGRIVVNTQGHKQYYVQ